MNVKGLDYMCLSRGFSLNPNVDCMEFISNLPHPIAQADFCTESIVISNAHKAHQHQHHNVTSSNRYNFGSLFNYLLCERVHIVNLVEPPSICLCQNEFYPKHTLAPAITFPDHVKIQTIGYCCGWYSSVNGHFLGYKYISINER